MKSFSASPAFFVVASEDIGTGTFTSHQGFQGLYLTHAYSHKGPAISFMFHFRSVCFDGLVANGKFTFLSFASFQSVFPHHLSGRGSPLFSSFFPLVEVKEKFLLPGRKM